MINSPAGFLTFSFRTNETDGLLLYLGGSGTDAVAFELRDGQLHFVLHANSIGSVFPIGSQILSNSRNHRVELVAHGSTGLVRLNNAEYNYKLPDTAALEVNNLFIRKIMLLCVNYILVLKLSTRFRR